MPNDANHIEDLVASYIDRLNRGERLTADQVREDHPQLAEEILDHLETFVDFDSQADGNEPLGTLGDYTLRRQIGRGGMGVVYEAWENSLDRRVALKVLPPGVAADPRSSTRFLREAQIVAKLSHPQIVPVYATGIKDGTPWYAMEFVDGETLGQVLTKLKEKSDQPTPFGRTREDQEFYLGVARAFADVADGLQHAHSNRIIHRDIKPSNLIIDQEGRLRILDFGLARLEGQESLTASGDFLGTPLYMSPEQAQRKQIPVDHRTDVYSLGATLYEMLTLRPPFEGKDHADTLSQIIERDPVEPRKVNPRFPKDLETIVLKCLRKDAGDRYGTAEALGQDLRRFVRGEVIEARPLSKWEILARRVRRHWRKSAAGVVAAVVLLICAALAYRVYQEQRRVQFRQYERSIAAAAMKVLRGELVLTDGPMDGPTEDFFLTVEYRDLLAPGVTHTLEAALEELQTSVDRFPGRVEARYFRAKGLWLLGKRDEAKREVEGALRADPHFAPALALEAAIRNELDARLEEIIRAHQQRPSPSTSWNALWAKSLGLAHRGAWETAASAYGDLIAVDEESEAYPGAAVEHRLRRGIANLQCKRYIDAVLDFQAAQTRARLDWQEFLEPGLLLGNALHLVPAERVADELFAHMLRGVPGTDPDEVSLWVAGIYAMQVNTYELPEDALLSARKVVSVRPKDPMSHVVLGNVLLWFVWNSQRGLLKEFLKQETPSLRALRAELAQEVKAALELGPESPTALGFVSKALEDQGELAEAREAAWSAFALERRRLSSTQDGNWETPPHPAPESQWNGAECEEGYFEVLGRVMDPEVNSPGRLEWGLGISADGRQLVFSSERDGGAGSFDIYSATWDTVRGVFGDVRRLANVSSENRDSSPSLSSDGLSLYLQLFPPKDPWTLFGEAKWDSSKNDFGAPEEWPEFRVFTKGGYMGPLSISFDSIELFFSAKEEHSNSGDQDLYVAWRDSIQERFSAKRARRLREIDSPYDDVCPTTSKDGKTIFWSGFLSNSHAGSHGRELVRSSIWMATRPRLRNPDTGEPEPFHDIRWVRLEPEVPAVHFRVTADWPAEGARAYFCSALPRGGSVRNDFDIYVAVWRKARR